MSEPVATREPRMTRWRNNLVGVIVIWAVWALITTFGVQPFKIPSGSMESTLGVGDRILVSKWTGVSDIKRGDVVVFADVNHWETGLSSSNPISSALRAVATFTHLSASGNHLVKRVIGLPGDRVQCVSATGQLRVNGVAIDEPYVFSKSGPCAGYAPFSIVVPAGSMWVMGDHRDDSADSRAHDDGTGKLGSVPLTAVIGRSIAKVWPFTALSGSANDEAAFSKVPPAHG